MINIEKESQKLEDNSTSSNSENEFKELDNEIEKVVRGKTSFEEDKLNDDNQKEFNNFQIKPQDLFKLQEKKDQNNNSDKKTILNNANILKTLYQAKKEKLKILEQNQKDIIIPLLKSEQIQLNNNANINNNIPNLNNIPNGHNLYDNVNILNHNDLQTTVNKLFQYNNDKNINSNIQINDINKSIINTIYLNQLLSLYNYNCIDYNNNSNNNTFIVNNCIYNNNFLNNNVNNLNVINNNCLNNHNLQNNKNNVLDINNKNYKDSLLLYLEKNLENNYINNSINLNDYLNDYLINNLKNQLLLNNNNTNNEINQYLLLLNQMKNNENNKYLLLLNQMKNNEINNNLNLLNNQTPLNINCPNNNNTNNINDKLKMNNILYQNNFNILSVLNNNNQNLSNNNIINNNNSYKNKKSQGNKNIINLLDIFLCKDKRTTLMIKNIPNKYTISSFLEEININFKFTYDIFYLPIDYVNKCNLGFAFINFVEPFHIILFYELYRGKKWKKFNSEKICELLYAKFQGKKQLISHFEKGKVLSMTSEEKRPLILPTPNPLPNISLPYYYLNLFIKTYPNISYEIKECKNKNNNNGKRNNDSSISHFFSIKGNFLKI